LSGAAFDKAYLADQIQAHQATIAQFQTETTNGNFGDIKTFATNQLPILNMHLSMAQSLQASGQ
jgi:putative membrane protein